MSKKRPGLSPRQEHDEKVMTAVLQFCEALDLQYPDEFRSLKIVVEWDCLSKCLEATLSSKSQSQTRFKDEE